MSIRTLAVVALFVTPIGAVAQLNPPTVSKSFNPSTIDKVSGISTLTITLGNSNGTAITGVTMTDNYPLVILNDATPNASTTCTGGTLTAAPTSNTISLSGAAIPPGGCTVSVNVNTSLEGSWVNTIPFGGVTSDAGFNTTPASATLTVIDEPRVAKSFSPSTIFTGTTSTLTITLTNFNSSTPITGVAFTDTYPANLVNAPVPNASTTCGGTVTAAPGGGSVALSGGTIPSIPCTVTVSVTSNTPGAFPNTIPIGAVTSANAGSNPVAASATLTVNPFIPALSHWALLLLSLALAGVAVSRMR